MHSSLYICMHVYTYIHKDTYIYTHVGRQTHRRISRHQVTFFYKQTIEIADSMSVCLSVPLCIFLVSICPSIHPWRFSLTVFSIRRGGKSS